MGYRAVSRHIAISRHIAPYRAGRIAGGCVACAGLLFIADVTCVLAVGVASAGEGRLRRAEATGAKRAELAARRSSMQDGF